MVDLRMDILKSKIVELEDTIRINELQHKIRAQKATIKKYLIFSVSALFIFGIGVLVGHYLG